MRPLERRHEIVERDHRMDQAAWGGYILHNALYRRAWNLAGRLPGVRFLFAGGAIMMYSPLLPGEGCHGAENVVDCMKSGKKPQENE